MKTHRSLRCSSVEQKQSWTSHQVSPSLDASLNVQQLYTFLSSSRLRASISHKRLIKWFAMVIANKVASGLVNRVEQEQNIFKSITILLKN